MIESWPQPILLLIEPPAKIKIGTVPDGYAVCVASIEQQLGVDQAYHAVARCLLLSVPGHCVLKQPPADTRTLPDQAKPEQAGALERFLVDAVYIVQCRLGFQPLMIAAARQGVRAHRVGEVVVQAIRRNGSGRIKRVEVGEQGPFVLGHSGGDPRQQIQGQWLQRIGVGQHPLHLPVRAIAEKAHFTTSPYAAVHQVRRGCVRGPDLAHDSADQLVQLLAVVDELDRLEPPFDLLPLPLYRHRGVGGVAYQSLMEQQRKGRRRPLGARAEFRERLYVGQVRRRSAED